MSEPILILENINKYFNEDFSLRNIDLSVCPGEALAIMGENGSGKSSLMKIISGMWKRDSGKIIYKGSNYAASSINEAKKLGIHMVMQDIALFPNLTVAENVYTDLMPRQKHFPYALVPMETLKNCRELFSEFGIDIDAETLLGTLGHAQRHMIQILQAYISDADVVIFDEPSSVFSPKEKDILYKIIQKMKEQNRAILYITHLLEDIHEIADRITILYQGKIVVTRDAKDITNDDIIKIMSSSSDKKRYPKLDISVGKPVLTVKNLCLDKILSNISFVLRKGQILGITGLAGSGRSMLAKCLFGINKPQSGTIEVDGRQVVFKSPADAVQAGIAYLPEDRAASTNLGCLNLENNISISSLKRFSGHGKIDSNILRQVSKTYVDKLSIKPGSLDTIICELSGGNQQKASVARWMMSRAKIYILDEPTRGVDIASKTDVYNSMVDLIRKGASIILISSDMEEILGMCDTVAVMNGGEIACEMPRQNATKEKMLYYASTKGVNRV